MKLLRIIILASFVSVFVSSCIYFFMPEEKVEAPEVRQAPVVEVQYKEVLVASRAILIGEKIKQGLVWKKFSEESISSNFILQSENPNAMDSFSEMFARQNLYEGEPLMKQKVGAYSGYLSLVLKKGMRAFSIRISPDTAAGGFILPNDHVDILAIKAVDRERNGSMEADTIFKNVKVLAIDQVFEQDEDGKSAKIGETATLELSEKNVEILALEQQLADKIILTLRSSADISQANQVSTSILHKNKKNTVTLIKSSEFSEVLVGK